MRPISACTALARIAVLTALCICSGAQAQSRFRPDHAGLAWAYGDDVDVYAVSARWAPRSQPAWLVAHELGVRIDGQIAWWQGRDQNAKVGNLWDFAAMGVLRWAPAVASWQPFAEAAFGIHLLTHAQINADRDFGSAFQFGSRGSLGVAFGPRRDYEIAAFVEHISNAGLVPPNWGLTYWGIVLRAPLP